MNSELVRANACAIPPLDEQDVIADYIDRETARIDALIASHFNDATRFEEIAYIPMGVGAVGLVVATFIAGLMLWRHPHSDATPAMRLAAAGGLMLSGLASLLIAGYVAEGRTLGGNAERHRRPAAVRLVDQGRRPARAPLLRHPRGTGCSCVRSRMGAPAPGRHGAARRASAWRQ